MSGSWRIATLSGIGVYVHWTFLILLAWVGLMQGSDLAEAVRGLVFVVALFSIIVLHEMGHALAARRYGIPTKSITLLPIGGVALLERMPTDPKQELVVAVAGPAVNVLLAGLSVMGLVLLVGMAGFISILGVGAEELGIHQEVPGGIPVLGSIAQWGVELLISLLIANVMLIAFNLLPAFPMDGGRVLRALLAMWFDYVRATQIAASVGRVMAIGFALLGLFVVKNPFLVLIAFFVWRGGAAEASMVKMKSRLLGVPVARAMIAQFHVLAPFDQIGVAAGYVNAGVQNDFPVLEGSQLVGVLTRSDLLKAMAAEGADQSISSVMRRSFETADPDDMLETVFSRIQESDCHVVPVVRDGQLYGLLTRESVGRFLANQQAGVGG